MGGATDIRRAENGDVEAIQRVAERAWDEAYDGVLDRHAIDETVEDWYSREFLSEAFRDEGTVFLVATEDDELSGFAHGVRDDDEGVVLRLYVDPDRWRSGTGTRLFEETRGALAADGARRLKAMVLAANEVGNEFYADVGMSLESTERTVIDDEEYEENVYAMEL